MKCGTDPEFLSYMSEEETDTSYPWFVTHEQKSEDGSVKVVIIRRFETMEAATYFLTYEPTINQQDLHNGLYSVNGPVNGDFT
jgi:hypothetical protein